MKSRMLETTAIVVVTNYEVMPYEGGKYLHRFTPESTSTRYQFVANQEPILEEGERYSFGYIVEDRVNWVDISAISKAEDVNPDASFYLARLHGTEIRSVELAKSNERVRHEAADGQYLGRKYAWRIHGMAVPREVFDMYLEHIGHPSVRCHTEGTESIAYKEEGLADAVENLRASLVKLNNNRFRSPLIPAKKWFMVKGLSAITDKK
jgi:hypothetical protein